MLDKCCKLQALPSYIGWIWWGQTRDGKDILVWNSGSLPLSLGIKAPVMEKNLAGDA
jgi:hypothetical protein